MSLPDRIKKVRKNENLTQSSFGEKLSVTRDVISNFESGRVEPKAIFLNYLCEVFNINKDWLFNGHGDMYNSISEDEELAFLMGQITADDNPLLKKLIKILSQIDDEDDLDSILAVAKRFANKRE